jgi:dihydropteroate synthase
MGNEHLQSKALTLGNRTFVWGRQTYIMAILNITPDSFSGDGLLRTDDVMEAALTHARQAIREGADILDVGGMSTRPGSKFVSIEEEYRRVVPVIQALAQETELPISVDSPRAEVIDAALDAGAHLVNAMCGIRTPEGAWNEALFKLVARRQVPLIIPHDYNPGSQRVQVASEAAIGNYFDVAEYSGDVVNAIIDDLRASVEYARSQGVHEDQLIVDPGIGFGKTPEQNIKLLKRLAELRSLGLPVLVGASRKSFIGRVLGVPPEQRDGGTAAVTAFAIQQGADIIRVHNVGLNVQVARMTDALVRQNIQK